jgi:amino-acid N-acetyltransferase
LPHRHLEYTVRPATELDLPAIQSLLQPYVTAKKLLKRTKAELLTLISNGFVAEATVPSISPPEPMALATGDDSTTVGTTKHAASASGSEDGTSPIPQQQIDASASDTKLIVGFSAVEIYSRKLSEVQCLAVHEDFHGRGIGSELVRCCVEKAREKGVLEVMAISASDNFLRNLGFQYALPDQKRALFYQLKTRDQMNSEIDEE